MFREKARKKERERERFAINSVGYCVNHKEDLPLAIRVTRNEIFTVSSLQNNESGKNFNTFEFQC